MLLLDDLAWLTLALDFNTSIRNLIAKILLCVLTIYAIVGAVISTLTDWTAQPMMQLVYLAVYTLLPAIGAYSIYKRLQLGILLSLLGFLFISVRVGALPFTFPIFAPISLSISYGDFANGTGGLVDLFAIIVSLLLITLMRQFRRGNHEPKPTE